MGSRMKTTLNIDATVMAELKREAARQGRTMSEVVETANTCIGPVGIVLALIGKR
jgi:hypothetical protein